MFTQKHPKRPAHQNPLFILFIRQTVIVCQSCASSIPRPGTLRWTKPTKASLLTDLHSRGIIYSTSSWWGKAANVVSSLRQELPGKGSLGQLVKKHLPENEAERLAASEPHIFFRPASGWRSLFTPRRSSTIQQQFTKMFLTLKTCNYSYRQTTLRGFREPSARL